MSDLVVDPSSLTSAAVEIQQCAARLRALKLAAGFRSGYSTATFGQLAGAFKGATTDITDVAGAADQQIARSLANTSARPLCMQLRQSKPSPSSWQLRWWWRAQSLHRVAPPPSAGHW
ncbi:hypothetical protein [Gordonia sp. NPDC003585]|uniref:hypothetical protein n=1 Tax=Gordonia sp. NPDC003585 TaxID=3154275 RepID=UPI00339FDD40